MSFHALLFCFWIKVTKPAFTTCHNAMKKVAAFNSKMFQHFLAEVCALLSASKESRRHEQPGIPNFPPQPGSHGALSETLLPFL
jgi:hypothetical protein